MTRKNGRGRGSGGRPTKLTPELRAALCRDLAAGVPRSVAVERADIDYSTFTRWLQKGRRARRGVFFTLFMAVKKAEADAVARNVGLVQRAALERDEVTVRETIAPGRDGQLTVVERVTTTRRVFDWTAAAWWLERRHPDEFASNRRELRELQKQLAAFIKAARDGKIAASDSPRQTGPRVRGGSDQGETR